MTLPVSLPISVLKNKLEIDIEKIWDLVTLRALFLFDY